MAFCPAKVVHDATKIDDAWFIGIQKQGHKIVGKVKVTQIVGLKTQIKPPF
jgi:hypothetical protein